MSHDKALYRSSFTLLYLLAYVWLWMLTSRTMNAIIYCLSGNYCYTLAGRKTTNRNCTSRQYIGCVYTTVIALIRYSRDTVHEHGVSTRSSAMAEGPRDALVSIEKLAIDEWPWNTPKVITVVVIKWPYGISLPVCELLFQGLYLGPFSRHYHFWSERDCLWPRKLLHFWQ